MRGLARHSTKAGYPFDIESSIRYSEVRRLTKRLAGLPKVVVQNVCLKITRPIDAQAQAKKSGMLLSLSFSKLRQISNCSLG
jgi:hypothetical protein